ncbi:cytochrome P450 [Nocardia beijingensis]|uniref:Cytochrome P450 n=1 Tax=Nocardia beijingensis TaxID=95162 RepID=A0ABW7WR96_9NOCA
MSNLSTTDLPFDHHSPEYAANWRTINAELRRRCPVAHSEAHGGFWLLSKYDDVAAVATDDETFSAWYELPDGSHQSTTIPPGEMRQIPSEMDPPEFHDYRKVLNPAFSPAAVKKWEPYFRAVTTFCIDQFIESGSCDLVRDLGSPAPALLTMELLGLDKGDWRTFSDVAHTMIHTVPGEDEHELALQRMTVLLAQIDKSIAARRASPTGDLISRLVQARINGEPISDERLIQMITIVIFGGVDTTGSLLGSVLEWLYRNPEQRAILRCEPSLVPRATEEFLRYFSPVQGIARTATEDCIIRGQKISAGDPVMMSWASANFDEDVFHDPNEVILDRFPNRHQAFGIGIHRCLGSNLARLEFRVMLEEVLRRLPDFEITEGAERYRSIGIINGWVSLPASFTPGAREGSELDL